MSKNRKQPKPDTPPDGRGKRPTDPNQLAKWIMEQSTQTNLEKLEEKPGTSED